MNGWNAESFFRWIKGKKIAFIGVGVTNTDCIRLFARKGAAVSVLDKKSREQLGELAAEFEEKGIQLVLGEGYLDNLEEYDAVLRSPGVYFHHPALEKARQAGVVITSEMELFFRLCPWVHKGGNIGRALLPVIEEISPEDAAVVELSSFQLISMRQSPDVAVITNLAPNHLDVHKDMAEYIDSKKNLILHQDGFSRAVLNLDNAITREMAPLCRGERLFFSRQSAVQAGAFLREDGMVCMSLGGEVTPILPAADIRLPGLHNVENFLAAFSALWGEVPAQVMAKVAREFGGVAGKRTG